MFLEFPTQFELKDFFNSESFNRISQHFLGRDSIHKQSVENDDFKRWYSVPGDHMVPQIHTKDDPKTKSLEQPQYYPEEKELHLIKDYLVPFFKQEVKNFFLETKNKAKDFHIPQERFYYLDGQLDYLRFCLLDFEVLDDNENYLDFFSQSKEEIKKLIQKIEKELLPNSFQTEPTENKIKLKLSQKEVCLLFLELSKADKISIEQTAEKSLAKLIESNFMYFDFKSKNYVLMQNAYTYLIKLRTVKELATENDTFKKIFCK